MPVEMTGATGGHIESRVRRYVSAMWWARVPGGSARRQLRCSTRRITTIWESTPTPRATTSTTALRTTARAAAFCWKWRGLLRNRRVRPPHDVYFAAVTAEEQGLLGSQYLGMHPPVPARQIALDLNYDMLLPMGVPRSVNLTGAERIDFWPTVQTVAKDFDLQLLPDPTPMAGHYYRSDHFSLARVGIPAFSVDQGDLFEGRDEAWGHAQDEDYVAHHYHQPSDEYQASWDFSGQREAGALRLCAGLAGEPSSQSRWSGCREMSSRRRGRPAKDNRPRSAADKVFCAKRDSLDAKSLSSSRRS